MTSEQSVAWQQDAQETLSKLDMDKHNKDNFILYGAALAILAHDSVTDGTSETAQATASAQGKRNSLYFAQDELKAADEYLSMGLVDIARDELRHAQHFIGELRKAAYTPEQQAAVRNLQMRHDLIQQSM